MTQPYYPPQAPPSGYPPADPYQQQTPPQYPPQPYPGQPSPYGAPVGYAPPQYPPQPMQQGPYGFPAPPPVQQGPPLAKGTLDDFYTQPNTGGGKAISWKGKPDGYTVVGTTPRAVTQGDVRQETDPQTRQPKYHADGRAKFSLVVPLQLLAQYPDHPEGEGRLFIRGQLRDETVRAMAEAGVTDPNTPPEHGCLMAVTLAYRKPSNNIAQNIFVVRYWRPGTWDQNTVQQIITPNAGPGYSQPAPQQFQQQPQAANTPPQAPAYAPTPQYAPPNAQPQPPQQGHPQQYASAPAQPQYAPSAGTPAQQGPSPVGAAPAQQQYQQPQQAPQNQQLAPAPSSPGPGQASGQVQGQQLALPQGQPVPQQGGSPVPDPNSRLSPEQEAFLAQLRAQQAAAAPAQG